MALPCDLLPETPPSVADALSAPTDELMLDAVVALTPRGAAWGRDEAGMIGGTSPNMARYWGAIGSVFGFLYALTFNAAAQVHPSAITESIGEWEHELGLPDPCAPGATAADARIKAVRMKHAAVGGASPAYFICLARSVGYDITIEEPSGFTCDDSECDGDEYVADIDLRPFWIVTLTGSRETWFMCDEGECDADPLEGYEAADDLECLLQSVSPMHTHLIFNYAG